MLDHDKMISCDQSGNPPTHSVPRIAVNNPIIDQRFLIPGITIVKDGRFIKVILEIVVNADFKKD